MFHSTARSSLSNVLHLRVYGSNPMIVLYTCLPISRVTFTTTCLHYSRISRISIIFESSVLCVQSPSDESKASGSKFQTQLNYFPLRQSIKYDFFSLYLIPSQSFPSNSILTPIKDYSLTRNLLRSWNHVSHT